MSIRKAMVDYSNQGVVWYAMKTTYKKELKAKEYLDSLGLECFVPMREELSTKLGRKRVILKPAIHNLLFVKTDLAQLKDIKISLNYLHNRLATEGGVSRPIVVPTEQMEQFIAVTTHSLGQVTYVDLAEARLEKGTPVRITEGEFKGCEGELEKIKGKRDRRVVVKVGEIIAYKIDVPASFIEKI